MRAPLSPPSDVDILLSDGYIVRARFWPSRASNTPCILYLHGIQSHGGWYEWSASVLADCGAAVLLPDRRGSGRNSVARGDVSSAERWIGDLENLADWMAEQHAQRELWVVGVSWGGKLAAAWAARDRARVSRLLLVTPGLFPAVDVSFQRKAEIAFAVLARPQRRFEIPLNDPALFTANPEGRAFIADDPLRLREATARFFYQSLRLDRWLRGVPAGNWTIPTRVFLAEEDRIIRNDLLRSWTRRVSAVREGAITEQPFPGAHHTLELEADGAPLEAALRKWCG